MMRGKELARHESGHEWATDLEPDQAEALWYGMRSWIEAGDKRVVSTGVVFPARPPRAAPIANA